MIKIIVNTRSIARMIAKTIIAAIAANIVDATSAPIIMPKTNASSTPSIAAIIPKQLFFLHFGFCS